MDNTRAQARERGYVETVFGRRLYLPDIRSGNAQMRQYAERSAINAPMQGTAADIIKRAMITVDAWATRAHSPARLIMQVHDELVFEVPPQAVPDVTAARARAHGGRRCAERAAARRCRLGRELGRGALRARCRFAARAPEANIQTATSRRRRTLIRALRSTAELPARCRVM